MEEIDARGKPCPGPVLMTRELIMEKRPEAVRVLVDNDASAVNVSRFLSSQSYETRVEKTGEQISVTAARNGCPVCEVMTEEEIRDVSSPDEKRIMIMISSDRIGSGDDVLGEKLMANFISTLKEMGSELWRLVLVNNGVKLAVAGSPVLDSLSGLENEGVTILVCGTCLEHFGLTSGKRVGETTNMLDIVTAMQVADKVINL